MINSAAGFPFLKGFAGMLAPAPVERVEVAQSPEAARRLIPLPAFSRLEVL